MINFLICEDFDEIEKGIKIKNCFNFLTLYKTKYLKNKKEICIQNAIINVKIALKVIIEITLLL